VNRAARLLERHLLGGREGGADRPAVRDRQDGGTFVSSSDCE
jgi:hypothetical protein